MESCAAMHALIVIIVGALIVHPATAAAVRERSVLSQASSGAIYATPSATLAASASESSVARAQGEIEPPLLNGLIEWLHIPKAGSSFVSAIAGAFCPAIPYDHGPGCLRNPQCPQLNHTCIANGSPLGPFFPQACYYQVGSIPYCNAQGKRPLQDGMPQDVQTSFYARFPAEKYCLPDFKWYLPVHIPVPANATDVRSHCRRLEPLPVYKAVQLYSLPAVIVRSSRYTMIDQ